MKPCDQSPWAADEAERQRRLNNLALLAHPSMSGGSGLSSVIADKGGKGGKGKDGKGVSGGGGGGLGNKLGSCCGAVANQFFGKRSRSESEPLFTLK